MNVIIVEDEAIASKNLMAIIKEVAPELNIVGTLDSISSTVKYFNENKMPDLVFMDIQLADGKSFAIFNEVEITCPVIFTTAYDTYALEAFKVNSIDYLLKPIEPEHVIKALKKLNQLSKVEIENYTKYFAKLLIDKNEYLRTLLVKYRDKLIPVPVSHIAYFYIKDEITKIKTFKNEEWQIDKTLNTLMSHIDPSLFFRANRQFIIAHQAVKEVVIWFGNRLSVSLQVSSPEKIIISKAQVSAFKKWLTRNEY